MPKIDAKRFYTSQWDDYWGYVLDNPGSVIDGNDGVSVLLAAPSWKGETPKGVARIIRGESDIIGTLTRTQLMGGVDDLPNVKKIQESYKLQPLSAFLGQPAPAAAPKVEWPKWKEGDETKEAYWSYVALMLPHITPNAADKVMYDRLASLGVKSGQPWEAAKLDPEVREAMQQGVDQARAEMKKRSEAGVDAAKFFGTRQSVGANYMDRAMGVYMGIFGNVPQVSIYLSMPTDAKGVLTDGGTNAYTLHFTKEQLPPVKFFWSITMYSLPDRYLVENPIKRYSIGSPTPGLKTDADGSLTVYISAKSPGKDKESNWLPAPKGPFWTVMRCYGPAPEIINGTYKQPSYTPGR